MIFNLLGLKPTFCYTNRDQTKYGNKRHEAIQRNIMPKVEIKSKDQCKETNYNHIIQMYLNSQNTIHKSKKHPTKYNQIQPNIKKTKANSP